MHVLQIPTLCIIEQSAQEVRELFKGFLLKGFRPTSAASQARVTTAWLPDAGHQLCPNPVATRKQVGAGVLVHRECAKGEVGSCVPVLAHSFDSLLICNYM